MHRKGKAAEDLIAWVAGKNPYMNIVYAPYSDELGVQRNLNIQRIMRSERYQKTFATRIGARGWACNADHIEFVGRTWVLSQHDSGRSDYGFWFPSRRD